MSRVPFQFQFFQQSESEKKKDVNYDDGGGPEPQPPSPCPSPTDDDDVDTAKRNSSFSFRLIPNISQKLRNRTRTQLTYRTLNLNDDTDHDVDEKTRTAPPVVGATPPLTLQVCEPRHVGGGGPETCFDAKDNTDIVSGVYEGGLNVWECSVDLCRYLVRHSDDILNTRGAGNNNVEAGGKVVLELGCGHGLPACLFLREGIQHKTNVVVMFADYNDFVLNGVAVSNIVLNTRSSLAANTLDLDAFADNHVVMGAGDWMDMSQQLSSGALYKENHLLPSNGRFDIILAAETTYTPEAARDTALLLVRHLKPDSGVGLVACKRYYFGVGGGSDAFRQAVADHRTTSTQQDARGAIVEYRLSVETLKVYDNGTGNIRELLQIKCIPRL